jgi:VIT1/CCC1 family predicted Fe2+/Mn2+ transporter
MRKIFTVDTIRSFTFGVEDSLVSTIGLVSGIAAAGVGRSAILLTGIILIFVEAFSMSVGSLLSDNSAKEFEQKSQVSLQASLISAWVMFLSYLVAGCIVISPYFFFSTKVAFFSAIIISLGALFVLGAVSGYASRTSYIRKGITMMIIGGFAIFIGVLVGLMIR